MKTKLIITLGMLALATSSQAQIRGGILLGGGYLEDPDEAYAFGQLRGTFYEDDSFAHTVFFEILGYEDDTSLDFQSVGGFRGDGDITFLNFTLNYEIEAKLNRSVSFYFGGGAGVEHVDLDSRFDFSLDSDTNFVAQTFAGLRFNFGGGVTGQLGARYIFRDDFRLLGDQFETDDSVGYELSVGFKF